MGLENLDAIEATVARYGIGCDFRRTGPGRRDRGPPGRRAARAATGGGGELPDRDAVRASALPTYKAGVLGPARRRWSTRPPGLGAGRGGARRLGVRIVEHTPVVGVRASGNGLRAAHRQRADRAGRPGRLGTNAFPPLLRRLRLTRSRSTTTSDDRAAVHGPARRDRLGTPTGRRRHREPVPLLPAHRRQPHPLGRLRRDLPLRPQGPPRLRPAAGDVPDPGRALLRDLPAAGGAALHPPLGRRDRDLHAVLRVLRTASPAARPTRSATPAWASGRAGSAPT